jgi:hypothetical protein
MIRLRPDIDVLNARRRLSTSRCAGIQSPLPEEDRARAGQGTRTAFVQNAIVRRAHRLWRHDMDSVMRACPLNSSVRGDVPR